MIKVYSCGDDLINENKDFLEINDYMSVFFFIDAPLLKSMDKRNFALKCYDENETLLCIKVEPFGLILYGDQSLSKELINYLIINGYIFDRFLSEQSLGLEINKELKVFNQEFEEGLAMDFMECKEITFPTDKEVIKATINDLDEIYELAKHFAKDCGLVEEADKDRIAPFIDSYRLIKIDGKIASMAKITKRTSSADGISYVYTRNEYRGRKLAHKVVNACKNEIINNSKIATLNVDKKNPISNKIYYELGFRKVFDQSEFRKINND